MKRIETERSEYNIMDFEFKKMFSLHPCACVVLCLNRIRHERIDGQSKDSKMGQVFQNLDGLLSFQDGIDTCL